MQNQVFSVAFSVAADCAVFAYFLFAPFRTRFRYSYFKTALLAASLTVITVLVSVLFLTSNMFFVKYSAVGIALWVICAVLTFRIAIKGSSFEILFIVLMILNLYANMGVISKVIMTVCNITEQNALYYCLIRIAVLSISIPFYWLLLSKLYRQVLEFNIKFSFWRIIWVVPTLLYSIFYVKIIHDYWKYPIGVNVVDIVFAFLWAFTTYAVFCITLLMLIQNYNGITAKQQTELIAAQLKMQESQYQRLLENIESTARLRHDWRHHLLTINSLAESGHIEDLRNYMEAIYPTYMSYEEVSVCQNHIVNIILRHYMAIAKAHGITVTIAADIPKSLNIADTDLCVIFGNLVENAVDACTRQESNDRLIEIKAEIKEKQLAVLIRNTYQSQVVMRDNMYYSTKHEGIGVGLSSVGRVVKNNNGTMKIRCDGKFFKIYLLFNIG